MIAFLIIVTIGLLYAACVFDANLLMFVAAAVVVQIICNLIWRKKPEPSHDERQEKLIWDRFFSEMKHSPWSELFTQDVVKEKLSELNEVLIKSLYQSIQHKLQTETDVTCCKNLRFTLISIRNEIANRKIEAYRHAKREKKGNYAAIYAHSLKESLLHKNLSDTESLEAAEKYSDAELVFVILDTSEEIHNSTAELTTGREEEMEACYHNNLRRIEFLLRQELAKRFFEGKNS